MFEFAGVNWKANFGKQLSLFSLTNVRPATILFKLKNWNSQWPQSVFQHL